MNCARSVLETTNFTTGPFVLDPFSEPQAVSKRVARALGSVLQIDSHESLYDCEKDKSEVMEGVFFES